MQTSTLADVVQQKNLGAMPVMNYREENGKAVIEIQLQRAIPELLEPPRYDAERLIAVLRAGRINLGVPTNVTKDIRRERDSSPPSLPRTRKSKKG